MVPEEMLLVEEKLAVFLFLSPGGGVDGGVGYGMEVELMILSQRSRNSSAFRTKMGYISFSATELNAGAKIRLCRRQALKY